MDKLISSKHVGYFAGFALLFNQMTGPGVPFTASNFQSPGWLFTTLCYAFFCMISGFSIMFLVEAIQAIPGNGHFQGNVEFATLFNFYFGPKMHILSQFFLWGALQSGAIQSLVLISQSIDTLLAERVGTCALTVKFQWICTRQVSLNFPSPFEDTMVFFSLGFLITLMLSMPLGLTDLDDNIKVVVGSCILGLALALQWISASIINGPQIYRLPVASPLNLSYGQVVGTVMLNLACCTVVPSLINIKSKDVNAHKLIWSSIIFTSIFYIILGVFLALGFDINPISNNILNEIIRFGKPDWLSKATVGMFSLVMLLPGIPVNIIVSKKNLIQNKVTSETVGSLLSFLVPILLSIPFQTGSALQPFQTWTSLIFVSSCNFIIPGILYFKCKNFRQQFNHHRILTKHQLSLLYEIHSNSAEIKDYILKKAEDSPMANGPDTVEVQLTIQPGNSVSTFILQESPLSISSDSKLMNNFSINEFSLTRFLTQTSRSDNGLDIYRRHMSALTPSALSAVGDRTMVSFRSPVGVEYVPLSDLVFVDPKDTGIASILEDDIPDPELPDRSSSAEREVGSIDSEVSILSLPRNRNFRTPAFRSVPSFMNISESAVAATIMYLATAISALNIIFNIVIETLK